MTKKAQMSGLALVTIGALVVVTHFEIRSATRSSAPTISIDPQIRIEHAKELFGRHYQTSVVRRAETISGLDRFLVAQVQSRLPDNWRGFGFKIAQTIAEQAQIHGFDPIFLLAVITRESRFDPAAVGRHGEIGLMQLKPDTAKWVADKAGIPWRGADQLRDPINNIRLGVAYFYQLRKRYDGHSLFYISAYNMGPKRLNQLIGMEQKPSEYAGRVMNIYSAMYRQLVRESVHKTSK
ncbi:MAG: lytic transglycosylase domain-containing protein, partial [Bdellovibrionales bacterium]